MSTKDDTTERKRKHRLADRIKGDKRLGKLDRLIGVYLANLCDAREEYAFALQQTIADEFDVSVRSVGRAVSKLAATGYFTRKRSGRKNQDGWGSNTYHPNWSVLTRQECPTSPAQDAAGLEVCPIAMSEVTGQVGHDRPMTLDSSDRTSQTELSDITLPEQLGEHDQEPYQVNCAASRTVPVASPLSDDRLIRFARSFPGDVNGLHNGLPAGAYLDSFNVLVDRLGLVGVQARAQARVRQYERTGGHRPIALASFLVNEEAALTPLA